MFEAPSIIFAAAGLAVFAAALLPKLLRNAPLSMPMVFLAAGMLAFTFIPELPDPDPLQYGEFTTHLTEICVIISLMGAGLALDRPVGRRDMVHHLADAGRGHADLHHRPDPAGALGRWGWGLEPRCWSQPRSRRPTPCWPPKCRWASPPTTRTKPSAAKTRSASASPPRQA